MNDPKIRISNVVKSYGGASNNFTALDGVSIDVRPGEFLCIVGPSGCGKSTLLKMCGNLEEPTRGRIEMTHEDLSRPLNAMIFQQESVFPWMTVAGNAAYGIKTTGGWKGKESQEKVDYFLEKTGLSTFKDFYPGQLSGGMKQRLAIARGFATNPEILLMDEPFAALDEQNKHLLQSELAKLWEEFKSTVVFITHGLEEALLLGDRVVVMSSAPGRIIKDIEVPFERPRQLSDLKRDPEFNQLSEELWDSLRSEVLAARELETKKLQESIS